MEQPGTGESRGSRGAGKSHNYALILVSAALVVVTCVLVWGMVKYRLPGKLWARIDGWENPLPAVAVRGGYGGAAGEAQLAYSKARAGETSVTEWQQQARVKLAALLGIVERQPAREVRSEGWVVGPQTAVDGRSIVRETVVFVQADGQEVPGFVLRPDRGGPYPGVLVIPGHSRGIVATAGIVADYQHDNARVVAEAGYVVLTMEVRGFGYLSRMGTGGEVVDLASHVGYALASGRTALGITVTDGMAGLDYLETRKEVNRDRLGVVGFSSGGKAAIYLAALDERVAAVVASGCVLSHEANFRHSRHDGYEAIPGIVTWLRMGDCLGLIAPRALLVHWGEKDTDTKARCAAYHESSLREFAAAREVYEAAGAGTALEKAVSPAMGHEFDNEAAVAFLRRRLGP